jgi:hypothetical protein
MFVVWFESLCELTYGQSNELTRRMQRYYCGSVFFHTPQYSRFAFGLEK